jgi:hypothetical protein
VEQRTLDRNLGLERDVALAIDPPHPRRGRHRVADDSPLCQDRARRP